MAIPYNPPEPVYPNYNISGGLDAFVKAYALRKQSQNEASLLSLKVREDAARQAQETRDAEMHPLEKEKLTAEIDRLKNGTTYFDPSNPGRVIIAPPGAKPLPGSNNQIRNEATMRGEFTRLTKPYRDVRDSFARIKKTVGAGTAAGDLSTIFAYMKILDPISVVREGEQATAENARGIPESVRNIYNKVMSGQKLTPDQRKDFSDRAGDLYSAQKGSYLKSADEYRRLATESGLDASRVVYDQDLADDAASGPGEGGAGAPSGAPVSLTGDKAKRLEELRAKKAAGTLK